MRNDCLLVMEMNSQMEKGGGEEENLLSSYYSYEAVYIIDIPSKFNIPSENDIENSCMEKKND